MRDEPRPRNYQETQLPPTRRTKTLSSSLTCAILTVNPAGALRQAERVLGWTLGPECVILDGSPDVSVRTSEKLGMPMKADPKIRWVKIPRIGDRFFWLGENVTTPYCLVMSDDDLFLESGVTSALRALERNFEASHCLGAALHLIKNAYSNESGLKFPPSWSHLYGRLDWSNQSKHPRDRLQTLTSPYRIRALWSVHRTSSFRTLSPILGQLPDLGPGFHPFFFESILEVLSVFIGTQISVNQLLWLRRNNTYRAWPGWTNERDFISSVDGRRALDFIEAAFTNSGLTNAEAALLTETVREIFVQVGGDPSRGSHSSNSFSQVIFQESSWITKLRDRLRQSRPGQWVWRFRFRWLVFLRFSARGGILSRKQRKALMEFLDMREI